MLAEKERLPASPVNYRYFPFNFERQTGVRFATLLRHVFVKNIGGKYMGDTIWQGKQREPGM